MLRRQPTRITLVQDDIVAYDNLKIQRDAQMRKQELIDAAVSGNHNNNNPFDSDMFVRKDTRSKDQRIGL